MSAEVGNIFESVPSHFWNSHQSRLLRSQLLKYNPRLNDYPDRLQFIWGMLVSQNFAASIYSDPEFRQITQQRQEDRGEVVVAMIPCFDGRFATILIAGRTVSYHPAAGGLIEMEEGIVAPRSAHLRESLKYIASFRDRHLLELGAGHGPALYPNVAFAEELEKDTHSAKQMRKTYGEICGKMVSIRDAGGLNPGESLVTGALRLQRETTEKGVGEVYNRRRRELGFPELDRVYLPLTFDTYRRGFILDYGQTNQLSTTELTKAYVRTIERWLSPMVGYSGSMAESYTRLDYALALAKNRQVIVNALMGYGGSSTPELVGFRREIIDQLRGNHPELSDLQMDGLADFMAEGVAVAYLASLHEGDPVNNPHTHHGEVASAISKGSNPFVLFPHIQIFASNIPDAAHTPEHARLQVSLMQEGHEEEKQKLTMFLPTPLPEKAEFVVQQNALADNGEMVRSVYQDERLGKMIEDEVLDVYPLISGVHNRGIIEVPNQSDYAQLPHREV